MNLAPKAVLAITPASFTNGATASGIIDTKGADRCDIFLLASASNDTTNNLSVLTVSEGDTSTSFTNVSGFVGDTDFTIAADETTVTKAAAQLSVDCRGRKRYLKIAASPVTTQVIAAVAVLTKQEQGVDSAADANVRNLVVG